jgi:hypothetical protein
VLLREQEAPNTKAIEKYATIPILRGLGRALIMLLAERGGESPAFSTSLQTASRVSRHNTEVSYYFTHTQKHHV